jgi:hypothetical protein
MMSKDIPSGFVPVYRVQLQPSDSVEVRPSIGSVSPAQIVLTLRDHLSLERSLQINPQGAILVLDMKMEVAVEIYRQIEALARTIGWSLPKSDKGQI